MTFLPIVCQPSLGARALRLAKLSVSVVFGALLQRRD